MSPPVTKVGENIMRKCAISTYAAVVKLYSMSHSWIARVTGPMSSSMVVWARVATAMASITSPRIIMSQIEVLG